ncbi:hypothetical protein SRHO_G00028550 [Serrasalmus rhombeus]
MQKWEEMSDDSRHRKLTPVGRTRWWAKDRALTKVCGCFGDPRDALYVDLLLTLVAIKGDDTMKSAVRAKAKGHMETLMKYEVILTAQIFLHIFKHTSPLSKFLQTHGMDILAAQRLVEGTEDSLNKYVRDFEGVKGAADVYAYIVVCLCVWTVFSVRFVYHDIMDSRRFSVEDPTSSCRVRRDEQCHAFISSLTQHSLFRAFILMIIIVNSFVIALEEEYNNPGLFREAEWIFLILYVLEFSMRVYVEPRSFWRSGFNIFSSALLLLSLVAVFAEGATSFFSLQNFRPFRALRVLKIISFFPSLQALVVVLAKAMKRAVYVMCLVLFIMYIFAVAGVLYFGEQATGDTEHWGDLGSALLTVFGLITLDSWVDLLRKVDGLGVAYSRLFPIIFILMGHFIFFNMFVGLVIMEVERMTKAREEEALQEREAVKKGAKKKRTMKQLIGSQLSKLKKWSGTNIKTDMDFNRIIQHLRMSLSDSDRIVTKDKSSSLTFLQIYLTTLRHQDATLDKLQQIYDEMLEVLSELLELLELQQEEQREEEERERDPQ